MNVQKHITLLVAGLAATGLSGCLEIETTTSVRPDGSLRREIHARGDSTGVRDFGGLFHLDSAWSIDRRQTDTTWESVAFREFPDVSVWNTAMAADTGRSLRIRASLETHFAWFTTEIAYSETLLCYNQFHAVPISAYLSRDEVERWLRHEMGKEPYPAGADSLAVRDAGQKAEEWDVRNKFMAYHALFEAGAHGTGDARLAAALEPGVRETLFVRAKELLNRSRLEDLPALYEKVLGTPAVRMVFEHQAEAFADYAARVEFQERVWTAGYRRARIEMPGLVTATNARSIEGNRLTWEEFVGAAYVTDYTMWARSRVINWWALVLTGGGVLLLAAVPLAAWLRARRRSAILA